MVMQIAIQINAHQTNVLLLLKEQLVHHQINVINQPGVVVDHAKNT